jgi:hypothetical protein
MKTRSKAKHTTLYLIASMCKHLFVVFKLLCKFATYIKITWPATRRQKQTNEMVLWLGVNVAPGTEFAFSPARHNLPPSNSSTRTLPSSTGHLQIRHSNRTFPRQFHPNVDPPVRPRGIRFVVYILLSPDWRMELANRVPVLN